MRSLQLNFKYWFKFIKEENLKYISHLDLLRAFERAIRRSNIPILYTHGFNPRQKLSFALPIPVGINSISEYGELLLSRNIQAEDIKNKINECLPKGLLLEEVIKVNFDLPTLMSKISRADYSIFFKDEININYLNQYMSQSKISYLKKTKHKEKEIDLKEYIYKIELDNNNKSIINICLRSGSAGHLKPSEFLISFLKDSLNNYKITRTEMYIDEKNSVFTPFQYAYLGIRDYTPSNA